MLRRLWTRSAGDDGHAPRQVLLRLIADVPVRRALTAACATGGTAKLNQLSSQLSSALVCQSQSSIHRCFSVLCFAFRSNWVEPAADFDAYYGVSQPRQVADNLTTASPLLSPAAAALLPCGAAAQPLKTVPIGSVAVSDRRSALRTHMIDHGGATAWDEGSCRLSGCFRTPRSTLTQASARSSLCAGYPTVRSATVTRSACARTHAATHTRTQPCTHARSHAHHHATDESRALARAGVDRFDGQARPLTLR